MDKKIIIFTDLDGSLLDSRYSFEKALPALRLIKKKNIPLLICSSKTKCEIEHYRKKLRNAHPFISENGGGIFIPKNYFKINISKLTFNIKEEKKYFVIKLGTSYSDLRNALDALRSEGFNIKGFGDMTASDISKLTRLKISEAKMAKKRDFDEPFVFRGDKKALANLKRRIKSMGFNYTEGKLFHLMGNSNKGRAVEIVKKLYSVQKQRIITVAIGDSPNDKEMLETVDYPIVLQKHDGTYDKRIKIKNLIRAHGRGSAGWNRAVNNLLRKFLCNPYLSAGR